MLVALRMSKDDFLVALSNDAEDPVIHLIFFFTTTTSSTNTTSTTITITYFNAILKGMGRGLLLGI